jgi:hypothetical protein
LRSDGRNWRITASRARSSDIGSEREKSRIGARRAVSATSLDPFCDFFRAIRKSSIVSNVHQRE